MSNAILRICCVDRIGIIAPQRRGAPWPCSLQVWDWRGAACAIAFRQALETVLAVRQYKR